MCGITFFSNKCECSEEERLEKFNAIQHRGPDNSSYVVKNGNFLGTHRLAIINPTDTGNQPLESNGVVLICNGQIYNYLELADKYNIPRSFIRTDVDIILHLYNKYLSIEDICNELDGVFAFVIYDTVRHHTFIARDPLGVRPLFWSRNGNTVEAVCSEVKGMPNSSSKVEVFPPNHYFSIHVGLQEYSNIYECKEHIEPLFQRVQIVETDIEEQSPVVITLTTDNEHTRYEIPDSEVESLKTFINTNINLIDKTTYRTEPHITNIDIKLPPPPKSEQDKVYKLLETAVIKRIENSDRPVAFLCSGGIDSSIIFCIAQKYLKVHGRKMHVFSMEFEGSKSFDSFYVKMLMGQYREESNIEYTAVKFNWDDFLSVLDDMPRKLETYDPNTIRASIPMYFLAKYLRENTDYKVFLSGEGADELFMGYNYFSIKTPPPKNEHHKYSCLNPGTAVDGHKANLESARLLKNLHMFDVLRADRTFAANGLELRVPYLDKALVTYVLGLKGDLKLPRGSGEEKPLLRDAVANHFPQLERARILNRQKERFSDGCGYSYVPKLLDYVSGTDEEEKSLHLTEKKERERKYHMMRFRKHVGTNMTHLIVKRELPDWCNDAKNAEGKDLLVSN